jgi:hypothetical protein
VEFKNHVEGSASRAERIVETQRKLLRDLIEAVTPPLAMHASTGRVTTTGFLSSLAQRAADWRALLGECEVRVQLLD